MYADFATLMSSPNFDDRQQGNVDMIVLHYTGMATGTEALARLCNADAKVSAHYVLEEDGTLFSLVAEDKRAWHAGVSHWAGLDGVNECSIGVEIVNPGHWWGYKAFPQPQIEMLLRLLKDIQTRWGVPKSRIIGHSDVAPERKEDPGELFPWDALAKEGLALEPFSGAAREQGDLPDYEQSLQMLRGIGYRVDGQNYGAALVAFQRHFCVLSLGQGLDVRTRTALQFIHQSL